MSASNVKLKVRVNGVSKSTCNSIYSRQNVVIGDEQICAGGEKVSFYYLPRIIMNHGKGGGSSKIGDKLITSIDSLPTETNTAGLEISKPFA